MMIEIRRDLQVNPPELTKIDPESKFRILGIMQYDGCQVPDDELEWFNFA